MCHIFGTLAGIIVQFLDGIRVGHLLHLVSQRRGDCYKVNWLVVPHGRGLGGWASVCVCKGIVTMAVKAKIWAGNGNIWCLVRWMFDFCSFQWKHSIELNWVTGRFLVDTTAKSSTHIYCFLTFSCQFGLGRLFSDWSRNGPSVIAFSTFCNQLWVERTLIPSFLTPRKREIEWLRVPV